MDRGMKEEKFSAQVLSEGLINGRWTVRLVVTEPGKDIRMWILYDGKCGNTFRDFLSGSND